MRKIATGEAALSKGRRFLVGCCQREVEQIRLGIAVTQTPGPSNQSSSLGSNLGRPDPQPQPMPRDSDVPVALPGGMPVGAEMPIEIAGYRIQRVLGAGGMATVFAAMQSQPRRIVALKIMKPALAAEQSKTAHRRFRREIEILGKLHHPYIAQVYGAGVHDEDGRSPVPYFVMEYVLNAKTILEHIAAKDLPLRDRLKLFAKICAGVDHGHKHKVIHRDLKPSNILIDEYGEPKIIDFGVALANEIDVESQAEATGLIGTLSYMSPEQVSNKPVDLDARCDVYSLGALLYKMLTGRPAHDLSGKSVTQAARIIREQTPVSPGKFKPELRGDQDFIIMKAMARLPANRYRNAGSLGRDIMRYLNHQPIHARRSGLIRSTRLFAKRHRAAITAGIIATIVIACGLSIIAFERWRMRGQQSAPPTNGSQSAVLDADQVRDSGGGPFGATLPDHPLREMYELKVHTGRINGLDMQNGPNGARLASVSIDHKLIVWDLKERQLALDLDVMNKPLTHVSMTGDGRMAAVAGGAEPLHIVDIEQGKVVRTIRQQSGEVAALRLSPDGSKLAYTGEDFALHIVDVLNPDAPEVVFRSSTGLLASVTWSADGTHVIAGSRHGPVYVWSMSNRRIVRQLADAEGELVLIAFAAGAEAPATQADGDKPEQSNRIVAVYREGKVYSWKWNGAIDDPKALVTPTHFDARSGGRGSRNNLSAAKVISAALLNADASRLLVAVSNEVIIWDIDRTSPKPGAGDRAGAVVVGTPVQLEDEVCTAIALEPDEQGCALGMSDGTIRFVPLKMD